MLSGQVAKDRPEVDGLVPMHLYLPVDVVQPGGPSRRERRPAIIKAVKASRKALRS